MKLTIVMVSSALLLLTGCELLNATRPIEATNTPAEVANPPSDSTICVWKNSAGDNNCKIEYWLQYWSDIEEMTWPQRQEKIDALSDQDGDLLKKAFLSQGKSTPYQARLRAQGWVETILPKLSQAMRRFILVALYHPSQDLLEMESALVTLSKINTHQAFNIEEQKLQLDKQKSQIDQLLNIETSIMESIEEDKE